MNSSQPNPRPRQERDREDLLAEATALVERIELSLPGVDQHVVVGFRANGAASVYFGQDAAYQFNSAGELRRAFVAGRLFKAENRRLVALHRQRSPGEVALVHHDLTPAETSELLAAVRGNLESVREALNTERFTIVGQVPGDADVTGRVKTWLEQLTLPPTIAARPHAQ